MAVEFRRWATSEAEDLADLLSQETWPYHSIQAPDRREVLDDALSGRYDNQSTQTYWVMENHDQVGLLRLDDLDDGSPLFDLRLRRSHRGRGLGTSAVQWLTAQLFQTLPEITRIEANTRQDNEGMRRVLRRCGYVKEAHHRQAWPTAGGAYRDAIGYAILRGDWNSGTTTAVDWDDG